MMTIMMKLTLNSSVTPKKLSTTYNLIGRIPLEPHTTSIDIRDLDSKSLMVMIQLLGN